MPRPAAAGRATICREPKLCRTKGGTMGDEIDLEQVRRLKEAELRRFVAERPRSSALQERARASMPGLTE